MRATALLVTAFFMACGVFSADAAPPSAAPEIAKPVTEVSAQRKRRPRVLIYRSQLYDRGVYPSYNPGPNAVRDCSVRYVQEFRPSGTVIVPDMKCFWRQP